MLVKQWLSTLCLGLVLAVGQPTEAKPDFPPLKEVLEDTRKSEGFLDLHQGDDSLYLQISKRDLEEEFYLFSSLSGGSLGYMMPGWTLSQGIFYFKRIGQEVWLFERNTGGTAPRNSPEETAVERAYLDSLVHKFTIAGASKGENQLLIRVDPFFYQYAGRQIPSWMSQWMGILGTIPKQSYIKSAKAFPENLEFQVQTTMRLNGSSRMRPDSNQLIFHFSMLKRQSSGYRPRAADERIGYFTTEVKDFSKLLDDGGVKRNILRWNLKKSDPRAKRSVVKAPIVFWLDESIPHKYRPFVRAGILEWNKAFEKLGFIGAVEARLPVAGMNLDPADSRYATVSWAATSDALAVGPSRYDPVTGEILDADVLLAAGWILPMARDYDLHGPLPEALSRNVDEIPSELSEKLFPSLKKELWEARLNRVRLKNGVRPADNFSERARSLALALSRLKPDSKGKDRDQLRHEFIGAYIKDLTMHEIGHVLGLRHNFAASADVRFKQLQNPEYLQKNTVSNSVMDYNDLNVIDLKEQKNGFVMETLGAYDYKAIAYGYKQIPAKKETSKLTAIAASMATEGFKYATDEDVYGPDPFVQRYDLGSDPVARAKSTFEAVKAGFESVEKRVITTGDRFDALLRGVRILLYSHMRTTFQAASLIGGVHRYRDRYLQTDARQPMRAVSSEIQLQALQYLKESVFTPKHLKVPKDLIPKLRTNPWSWRQPSTANTVASFQTYTRLGVLYTLLSPSILANLRDFHEVQDSGMSRALLFENVHSMVFGNLRELSQARSETFVTQRFLVDYLGSMATGQWVQDKQSAAYARHSLELVMQDCNTRLKELNEARDFSSSALRNHLKELRDTVDRYLDLDITRITW